MLLAAASSTCFVYNPGAASYLDWVPLFYATLLPHSHRTKPVKVILSVRRKIVLHAGKQIVEDMQAVITECTPPGVHKE